MQDLPLTLRVSHEWKRKLDEWIAVQTVRPTRSEAIRVAVVKFIQECEFDATKRPARDHDQSSGVITPPAP